MSDIKKAQEVIEKTHPKISAMDIIQGTIDVINKKNKEGATLLVIYNSLKDNGLLDVSFNTFRKYVHDCNKKS